MSATGNKYVLAHLRTAEQILAHYDGAEPFSIVLKAFFRDNRKFGSKDRKSVSQLCYGFFRLGRALPDQPIKERIIAGCFLSATPQDTLIPLVRPEWVKYLDVSVPEREQALTDAFPEYNCLSVFPGSGSFSEGIDAEAFIRSHFQQPDLFIRVRPGRMDEVSDKLAQAGISFKRIGENTCSFPNGTGLECLGVPDELYVVQDLSSQRTQGFMPPAEAMPDRPAIWDACAGSGGKSILASDLYPGAKLTVSDNRESILRNLAQRFSAAGVKAHRSFRSDLTVTPTRKKEGGKPAAAYDLVIADVPCSGSGTWARAPWEMLFFEEEAIEGYVALQRRILDGVMPSVKPGGYLTYITCSAFARENEGAVSHILSNGKFTLLEKSLIRGYADHADTMFAALFISAV